MLVLSVTLITHLHLLLVPSCRTDHHIAVGSMGRTNLGTGTRCCFIHHLTFFCTPSTYLQEELPHRCRVNGAVQTRRLAQGADHGRRQPAALEGSERAMCPGEGWVSIFCHKHISLTLAVKWLGAVGLKAGPLERALRTYHTCLTYHTKVGVQLTGIRYSPCQDPGLLAGGSRSTFIPNTPLALQPPNFPHCQTHRAASKPAHGYSHKCEMCRLQRSSTAPARALVCWRLAARTCASTSTSEAGQGGCSQAWLAVVVYVG